MPVGVEIEQTGTYTRLPDNTAQVDTPVIRLNENPALYGTLKRRLDLSKGCENFKDEGYGDLYLSFFDYLKKKFDRGTSLREVIKADFFSNRQNLTLLAKSAFDRQKVDVIRALRVNGIIFLCNTKSENEKPYEYFYGGGFGYKFEQYMTLKENGQPHDENETVSNAECFKTILRTTFKTETDQIKVFYAAEMDAMDSDGNSIEIKSTRCGNIEWIKTQSLQHYLQCFLGNVKFFIKGHKTNKQFIDQVDKIAASSIPEMGVNWNQNDCLKRLFDVLHHVKETLTDDNQALQIKINQGEISYEEENAENCQFVDPAFLEYFN